MLPRVGDIGMKRLQLRLLIAQSRRRRHTDAQTTPVATRASHRQGETNAPCRERQNGSRRDISHARRAKKNASGA